MFVLFFVFFFNLKMNQNQQITFVVQLENIVLKTKGLRIIIFQYGGWFMLRHKKKSLSVRLAVNQRYEVLVLR